MFKSWKKSNKGAHKADQTSGTEHLIEHDARSEERVAGPQRFEIMLSLKTDVGCVREVNEDCVVCVQPGDPDVVAKKGMLILVADGMGGHSAGEVASNKAVEVISKVFFEEDSDAQSALRKAFNEASREIFEMSQRDESLRGMGTTCTALVLRNGSALAAHVGDSRLYLIRNRHIYTMTEDHSEVMEMVKRGLITLEQARHHPDKNVILRAIGSHADVEVSTWDEPMPVREGDRFLLCSDGLYDLVEDEEIRREVEAAEPQTACEKLIALAKERGGYDNISVGIVNLLPAVEPASKQVRPTREVEAAI